MKILLVEDDISIRMLLSELLKTYGYDIEAVGSAEEAWEKYQENKYSLLILDWILPHMSGLELCKKIHATPDGKYCYIWVITARDKPEDIVEVLEAGANDYLAKPIDIKYLKVRMMIAEQRVYDLQKRKEAELALQRSYQGLEDKVAERTQELKSTVNALTSEIEERKSIQNTLLETQNSLRALSSRLINIQEEQQKAIAREIHDELGQVMTAIKLDLSWMRQEIEDSHPQVNQKITKLIPHVSDTIKVIQRICTELRPAILDDLGIVAALEWLIQEFEERTQIKCSLLIEPEDLELNKDLSTTCFRIVQETLTNVMRHAQAKRVNIEIEKEVTHLNINVWDNGIGISQTNIEAPSSLGLIGMKERVLPWNGQVTFSGKQGEGTHVFVSIELPKEE